MSTTIITRKCSKCGYSATKRIYGYVADPIGMPIAICPACRSVSHDRTHKEWIQMTPFAKLCAIYPRAGSYGIFGGCAAVVAFFRKVSGLGLPDSTRSLILWGIFAVAALIIMYATLCIAVNSSFFISRYIVSVKRTRNQTYRQLISQFGKIHDESLPLFLRFSAKAQSDIAYNLRNPMADSDIRIPTLGESIQNA